MNRGRWHSWTDEELVPVARAEANAATELLQRYHVRVFQWCHAQLRDPDLAGDVAQEVLLKAYHGLGTFAGQAKFSSWLFAIARNRCLDELRRPRLLVDDEAMDLLTDPAPSPAAAFEARATDEEWKQLLARHLEPQEQEAVVLRYFECLPVEEITDVLGITQASGARGVLQSAKRKLRAAFGAKGGNRHDGSLPRD